MAETGRATGMNRHSNVIIAIADSGMDWNHPDLGGTHPDRVTGAVWTNWTEYYGNPNQDDDGNGMHFMAREFVHVELIDPEPEESEDEAVEITERAGRGLDRHHRGHVLLDDVDDDVVAHEPAAEIDDDIAHAVVGRRRDDLRKRIKRRPV